MQPQHLRSTSTTTTNMTAQQLFSQQRNHLYQKYGQDVQSKQMIGNSQIKQNQSIGKAQVKATYQDQMRLQQQINLARVHNQARLQQAIQQKEMLTQRKQMLPAPQQKQMITSSERGKTYQPRATTSALPISNNQQAWKRQQVNASSTPIGRVQGQSRFPVPKLLNNGQLRVTPITNNINKPAPTTNQQLRQEQMRQRINQLKQQKQMSLQQKLQTRKQSIQKNVSIPDAQKRQLEEMKNSELSPSSLLQHLHNA